MNHEQHESIARWERRWLAVAGFLSLIFVMLIAYSLATEGTNIAQRSGRATPEQLISHPLFAEPGVTVLGDNKFQVTIVGQTFVFTPQDITLPVGAEVSFYMTSRDVLHGYQVEKTNINVELIPGEIAAMNYTFDEIGTYRVGCNEYCGISHQNMLGTINIVPASQYALQANAQPEQSAIPGETTYQTNCASCHQNSGEGLTGAFPPLVDHTPDLYNADRTYLPDLLLYGLQGAINVNGSNYNGVMPAWAQLSDQDIADTINYILTNWGNEEQLTEFQPYTPEEIQNARGKNLTAQDVHAHRETLNLE